jgi:hypothetical protein
VSRLPVLRVGDRVRFDGGEYQVAGLDGVMVRLVPGGGPGGPSVVLLTHLLGAADFVVLSAVGTGARVPAAALLEGVPAGAVARAAWWERHVVELLTGLAPDAAPGTAVRAEYDPASVSLRAREMAKARELSDGGERVSLSTVQRMRRRYERSGIAGLVDGRLAPQAGPPGGQADARVIEAVREVMTATGDSSTVSRAVLMRRAERQLAGASRRRCAGDAVTGDVLPAGGLAGGRAGHVWLGSHAPVAGRAPGWPACAGRRAAAG